MSLMKLPDGSNCLQSTSPPCIQVTSYPGWLRTDNAGGLSSQECYPNIGCWWYPGGIRYGENAIYNGCTCAPGMPNRDGNLSVYAKQNCPNTLGAKYSATKTMYVYYSPYSSLWGYFGTLQIIDNGGCQPL